MVAGDRRYPRAAFFAYAYPAPGGFAAATLSPAAAHWDAGLGEYVLDWDDARASPDPHRAALDFAQSSVRHACGLRLGSGAVGQCAGSSPADRLIGPQPRSTGLSSGWTPWPIDSRAAAASQGARAHKIS